MKKFLVAATFAVSLAACTHVTPPPPVTVIAASPPVAPPTADTITPAPVQWTVYNAAELKDLSTKLAATGNSVVLYTLDTDGFKNLSNNLVDIKRFIGQQNAIIQFLTKAANQPNQAAANSTVQTGTK
jgi:hypothetical protein